MKSIKILWFIMNNIFSSESQDERCEKILKVMRLPTGGLLTATEAKLLPGDYGQHHRENEQKRNFNLQHSGKALLPLPPHPALSHCLAKHSWKRNWSSGCIWPAPRNRENCVGHFKVVLAVIFSQATVTGGGGESDNGRIGMILFTNKSSAL